MQDVSNDELNKKELNDKATAFKERHVEMQQIFFQQQDLHHMAHKVEKLHMAGVLLVECEDATADATSLSRTPTVAGRFRSWWQMRAPEAARS